MRPDVPLIEAAREVQSIFVALGIEAVIIGGLAIFRWGEPRLTRDVDFTALGSAGQEEEPRILAILARLRGRIDVRQGKNLDWKLIETELKRLLEVTGASGNWDRLVSLKARTVQR